MNRREDVLERAREIVERLVANHANTRALIACLNLCARHPKGAPYRDIENALAVDPSMGMTMQTPHTLLAVLVKAGALDRVEGPEPSIDECDDKAQSPVDYAVVITDAGRAALEMLDPVEQFAKVLGQEPESYLEVYARVLDVCADPAGASRSEIEQMIGSHPALRTPKCVYPGYLVSKLETIGGLSWDGRWHTTASGEQILAAYAQ